jgi:tRNA-binding protein
VEIRNAIAIFLELCSMINGLELRVGQIIAASIHPKAKKPAYVLTIDFGEYGKKQSSAQITGLYTPEALVGKQVICAMNLGTKIIGGIPSEVLVLGVPDGKGNVILIQPERPAPNGEEVF